MGGASRRLALQMRCWIVELSLRVDWLGVENLVGGMRRMVLDLDGGQLGFGVRLTTISALLYLQRMRAYLSSTRGSEYGRYLPSYPSA